MCTAQVFKQQGMKNRVCTQYGFFYPSISASKRHRQDGCGLAVLGNKVIDEQEDIKHDEENSEILVADGDEGHAPIIYIYGLLMNNEFIEIQTDKND